MRGGEYEKSTLLLTHIPQHTTYMQAFTSKHSALAAQWDTLENDWKELRFEDGRGPEGARRGGGS